MRAFLQQWSVLIAAFFVVTSMVYSGMTLRTHTTGVNERLRTLERESNAIRNAIEGSQGVIARMTALDLHINEKLQEAIVQCDKYIESNERISLHIENAFEVVKNDMDEILHMVQHIDYIEDILRDIQDSIEAMKKQSNNDK